MHQAIRPRGGEIKTFRKWVLSLCNSNRTSTQKGDAFSSASLLFELLDCRKEGIARRRRGTSVQIALAPLPLKAETEELGELSWHSREGGSLHKSNPIAI